MVPWVAALAIPASGAALLAGGMAPGDVALGVMLGAFALAAFVQAGFLAILLVIFPFGPRIAMGPAHLYAGTAVVLLALFAWGLTMLARRGAFRALPARVGIPFVVLLALITLSALAHTADLAARPADVLRLVQLAAYLMLFPLAFDLAPQGRRSSGLILVAFVAGVLEALYALFLAAPGPGGFLVGNFDFEHNNFAAEMVLALLLGAGLFVARRAPGFRLAVAVGLPAIAVALLLSQSRTGLVAAGAGVLALAALPLPRWWRVGVLVALVTAAVAGVALAPPEIRARIAGALGSGGEDVHGLAASRRVAMWGDAVRTLREHPFFGAGIWSRELADNVFVKVAVELGLVGLAVFGWFLAAVLRECRRISSGATLAIGLFPAAVAILVVMNLAGDFFLVHRVMGSFWVLAGVGLRVAGEPRVHLPGPAPVS